MTYSGCGQIGDLVAKEVERIDPGNFSFDGISHRLTREQAALSAITHLGTLPSVEA